MLHSHRMELFTCDASRDFAEKVVESLNATIREDEKEFSLGDMKVLHFSDGEFQPHFEQSVRGATTFILQSTFPPADNMMELLLAIDAAKRASADKVIAVVPYFGWARQDRKDKPRVAIGAKLAANLLTAAGADRVMTCDLHAEQIQGFFDIPVDHVYASKVFIPVIEDLHLDNLAIAAPDMGGAKKANIFAKAISRTQDCTMVICHKVRERANVVGSITAIGEVKGKNVFIVDDMIDTAGTLCKAADVLKEMGALSVRACASHGVLSGSAVEKIHNSALEEVYITDTIPHPELANDPKIRIISMAPVFANIIRKVYNYEPVSTEFER